MDLLQAIGNTPLVRLANLNPNPDVEVLCKLEGCNPGGSVKDRPALYMITKAEESGELTRDKIILEPTSGNTGIAIAMIGAAKGYEVQLCMPECVSSERRLILEGFGAHVYPTAAKENIDGAIRQAHALMDESPGRYYMPTSTPTRRTLSPISRPQVRRSIARPTVRWTTSWPAWAPRGR